MFVFSKANVHERSNPLSSAFSKSSNLDSASLRFSIADTLPITFAISSNLSSKSWFLLTSNFWVSAKPPATKLTLSDKLLTLFFTCSNFPSRGVKIFTIVSLTSLFCTGKELESSFPNSTDASLTYLEAPDLSSCFLSSACLMRFQIAPAIDVVKAPLYVFCNDATIVLL